jgi:hypothetical protein
MLVQDLLQNSAARTPNKVVFAFQEQGLTCQEIDAHQANRLAQALLDHEYNAAIRWRSTCPTRWKQP